MVAQIVLMADTVQKLHGQDDLMLLRQRDKAPQPLLAVLPALQVRCAVTPAGEANQVGQSSVRHHRDHLLITGDQLVMQGRIIETSIYSKPGPLCHRHRQAMFLYDRPIYRVQQLNGFNPYMLADLTELVQIIIAETPFAYGVADISFQGFPHVCFLFSGYRRLDTCSRQSHASS